MPNRCVEEPAPVEKLLNLLLAAQAGSDNQVHFSISPGPT